MFGGMRWSALCGAPHRRDHLKPQDRLQDERWPLQRIHRFGGRTGRRLCAGGSYRAACTESRRGCTKSAPRSPGGQCVIHRRGRQRTTYRTWPTGPLRSASRIPDRGHRQRLARPSDAPRFGRRHRARRSRSKSPHLPVDRGGPSNGRYRVTGSTSRRRRHRPRSPGTSPATAAARRPRSASGTRSTVPAASPAARDASPEDERRSTAGRSRCRPRLQIRRGSTAPLGQPTRHHPQRPWPNRRLMDAPRPG